MLMKTTRNRSLSGKRIGLTKLAELTTSCIYSILSSLLSKKQLSKCIFIPFFGHLGDMIMFMDVLEEYKKIFLIEKNYHIILGCRREVWKILEVVGMDNDLEFFELTREQLDHFKYFRQKVREIKKRFPRYIINVRENNAIEHVYLHAIPAEEKYTYRSYDIKYANKIGSFFAKHTYTTIWTDQENKDQISCYADMVRLFGHKEYRSKVRRFPYIYEKVEGIPENYIAVCPGASVGNKCWPVERFIHVVNNIIKNTDNFIVICGGKNDVPIAETICSNATGQNRLFNIAGKTNIKQWIAVLQNAKFVLTNESGSIHIAASCAVPSICIGEQKYGNKWLPYRVEYIRDDDCFPTIVRGPKLSCEFCAATSFSFSEECKRCYQEYGVVRCVYEVTEEMIISEVEQYINAFCNTNLTDK